MPSRYQRQLVSSITSREEGSDRDHVEVPAGRKIISLAHWVA